MAETGSPVELPEADLGWQDRYLDSQLAGIGAYDHCRPIGALRLRRRCGDCGYGALVAFSCKRRGTCTSYGVQRMALTAAHLVDHVIRRVPLRQWVLSLPNSLRLLPTAQPKPTTTVRQAVLRLITRHLLGQAGLMPEEAACGTWPDHRIEP